MLEDLRSLLAEYAYLEQLAYVGLLVAGAALAYFVSHRILASFVRSWARRTRTPWDDALVEAEVVGRLAHLPPATVVYYGIQFVPDLHDTIEVLVQRVAFSVLIVVAVRAMSAFLAAANDLYSADPNNRTKPIKGYLQVVRDPIPSFVASVQLTGNDTIHVGDWIEMPTYGADGDVIDIALHTVKIQNWDKTITTIPTHAPVSDAFKNWRGMSQSGGRRIKRSLFIDVSSIRFLEAAEIEVLGRGALLRDYVSEKRAELKAWNQQQGRDPAINADIRGQTNVGMLRAYIARYLSAHPRIRTDMTLLVRQLQAADRGLPVEINCFTTTTEWNTYEGIQADIFDHMLAILPDFGLRAYQSPAGADIASLATKNAGDANTERIEP